MFFTSHTYMLFACTLSILVFIYSTYDWGTRDWGPYDWGTYDWGTCDWGTCDWCAYDWGACNWDTHALWKGGAEDNIGRNEIRVAHATQNSIWSKST